MLVASWNVNSIVARLPRLLAFLERVSPDVVCLQELKCESGKFPHRELEALGYAAAVYGQKTYNGVAVLAKGELEDVEAGFGDGIEDPEARLVAATFKGVRFLSAYVPNGQSVGSDKFMYKLEWLKRLRAYLDARFTPGDAIVLAGDFNVAYDERDVYDPRLYEGEIFFSLPERKALGRILEFGMVDTLRLHRQEAGIYSWWDYRQLAFPMNRGLRIDYLFASQGLASRCAKAWIDRDERKGEKPSDHAPVMAEFR